MKYLLLLMLIAPAAHAQSPTAGTHPYPQFTFSAAVGASSLNMTGVGQNGTHTVLSLPNMRIGYWLNPRVAVLLCLPGSLYHYQLSGRSRDRGFEGIIPSVQYRLGKRWWGLAGAGLTFDAPAFYDVKSPDERKFYTGPSALAAIGYNVWEHNNKALDVQLRWHAGYAHAPEGRRSGNAIDLLVGFSWHK